MNDSTSYSPDCENQDGGIACYDTNVTGNNLLTSLVVDTIIGLLCYIGFVLWRKDFSIYSRRLSIPNTSRRPPPLKLRGHWRLWSWLIPTWNLPDLQLLRSSGFDALVAVRVVSFGIPLLIPYVVLGVGVLIPVNYHGGYLEQQAQDANDTSYTSSSNISYEFLRISISNIPPGSPLLWVHFVVLLLIMLWTFFLLMVFWEEHLAIGHTILISEQASPQDALETTEKRTDEEEGTDDGDDRDPAPTDKASDVVNGIKPQHEAPVSSTSSHSEMETSRNGLKHKKTGLSSIHHGSSKFSIEKDPYVMWPVRTPDIPQADRPPGAGKYAVVIIDEPSRQFYNAKTKNLGMGVLRLHKNDISSEIDKFEKKLLGKYVEEEDANPREMPRLLSRLRSRRREGSSSLGRNHSAARPTSVSTVSMEEGHAAESSERRIEEVFPHVGDGDDDVDAEKNKQRPALTETEASNANLRPPYASKSSLYGTQTSKALELEKPKSGDQSTEGASLWIISIWRTISSLLPSPQGGLSMKEMNEKRIKIVTLTFKRLFGNEFDKIIPIYPSKKMDTHLMKLYNCQAALLRTKWMLDAGNEGKRKLSSKRRDKLTKRLKILEDKEASLQETAIAIKKETMEMGPSPCFFAVFHSARAANEAAHINPNPVHWRAFNVKPAPDADQVNFTTLERSFWGRGIRRVISLFLIIFIMLLPIGLITGIFSQLGAALCGGGQGDTGSLTGTWFCSNNKWASLIRGIITGVLPSILMAVYQSVVLPVYLYSCANLESKHLSLSDMDRRIAQLGFYWNVFNFFLGALLGGTVFNGLRQAIDNPRNIFSLLGQAIPASSNFFINYVMYRALTMMSFRLFFPNAEISMRIAQWFRVLPSPKAPVDIARAGPMRPCRYSRDFSVSVFTVYLATLAYSCIAPVILPIALLYFLLGYFVWRYQALYVFQSTYRANYVFIWAAHRIVAILGLTVVFMASMFFVKKAFVQAILCLTLLEAIVVLFDRYLGIRYDAIFYGLPCAALEAAPRVNLDPELFVAPPLRERARGWFLEWGKAWEFFGAPRGYF